MYKLIGELPLPAEQVDEKMLDGIPASEYEYCEMDAVEKRFLFGLIRYFKPHNILEVGVSSGGGSGLILASISDMPGATLTSIDAAEQTHRFPSEPVGFVALRKHFNNERWNLICGKDPSEVIAGLEREFDFAIIDTAHIHPIETLNFLSVLPFLTDGAVVVLHDISLFLSQSYYRDMKDFPFLSLATRFLFNSIAAEKTEPLVYQSGLHTKLVNIAAFQITQDTRKYIDGVFGSLVVPWAFIPDKRILDSIGKIIQTHYSPKQRKMFENAIRANYYVQCKEMKTVQDLSMVLERHSGKYILFGARDSEQYLRMINGAGYGNPIEIWDNYAVRVDYDSDVPVVKPHFDISDEIAMIFTVRTEWIYETVISDWPQKFRENAFFFKRLH
jgi:predicted O-methyltransferase YrrM